MTAVATGPYEHLGVYRPDVIAQIEGTEPQWADAPAECESPEPDLSGKPLPSLRDFARAVADEIGVAAYTETTSNIAAALSYAASMISWECRDIRPLRASDGVWVGALRTEEHRTSKEAWENLRAIRVIQLGGLDALRARREQQ